MENYTIEATIFFAMLGIVIAILAKFEKKGNYGTANILFGIMVALTIVMVYVDAIYMSINMPLLLMSWQNINKMQEQKEDY